MTGNESRSLKKAVRGLARMQVPALFLLCLLLAGLAAGFLVSDDSVTNRLSVGHNMSGIIETYDPPGSMVRGESYTKEMSVRNEGSVPCYVRVFAEIEDPDMRVAVSVNYDTSTWEKGDDGHYYYGSILAAGQQTTPVFTKLSATEDLDDFRMICYSETVQAEGFSNARDAFAAISQEVSE